MVISNAPLEASGRSVTGKRTRNEDAFDATPEATIAEPLIARKGYLYIVADGMGGHTAGDEASQLAVAEIRRSYYHAGDQHDIGAALRFAIEAANRAIYLQARTANGNARRMGATVVCAVIHKDELVLAHVGDCRAYQFSEGQLFRRTRDHDWASTQPALRDSDTYEREQATRAAGMVGRVARAVGLDVEVAVEISRYVWQLGDVLLLCSDGLLKPAVDEPVLQQRLATHQTAEKIAQSLIQHATSAGSKDNITAVVIRDRSFASNATGATFWLRLAPWGAIFISTLATLLLCGFLLWLAIQSGWLLLPGTSSMPTPTMLATPSLPLTSSPTGTPEPTRTALPLRATTDPLSGPMFSTPAPLLPPNTPTPTRTPTPWPTRTATPVPPPVQPSATATASPAPSEPPPAPSEPPPASSEPPPAPSEPPPAPSEPPPASSEPSPTPSEPPPVSSEPPPVPATWGAA